MDTKYFDDVKAAAPSGTDAKDHNGKYFQNISKGNADGQGCIGSGECYTHDRSVKYSSDAVNKAIDSSNKSGKKIGSKESKAIHRLLKGRY
jgi:ferredoxin